MNKKIFVLMLVLALLFLVGCSKSKVSQATTACKNLEAGQDNTLVYYPPFQDKAKIITNKYNADTYRLIEGELTSYSYDYDKINCKALIELCFDKGDYEVCQDKTIYFEITQDEWNNWANGKQLFN